jgi:hypothetical protein
VTEPKDLAQKADTVAAVQTRAAGADTVCGWINQKQRDVIAAVKATPDNCQRMTADDAALVSAAATHKLLTYHARILPMYGQGPGVCKVRHACD